MIVEENNVYSWMFDPTFETKAIDGKMSLESSILNTTTSRVGNILRNEKHTFFYNGKNHSMYIYEGYSFLHLAVISQNQEIVQMLLNCNVNVDTIDYSGQTPLWIAVRLKNFNIAELLLKSGANPNYLNQSKDLLFSSMLDYALHINDEKISQLLLQFGAVWKPKVLIKKKTLEEVTAKVRFTCFMKKLLKQGLDVNTRDEEGKSLLWLAVNTKNYQLAEYLLQNQSYPNFAPDSGSHEKVYPVHLSVIQNNLKMLKLLHKYNASLKITNKEGLTPLMMAQEKNFFEIQAYINSQANESALYHAILKNKNPSIGKFIKQGANVNYADECRVSTLWLALDKGFFQTAKDLIWHGANMNNPDTFPALHVAYRKDNLFMMKFMLQHGADVNIRDEKGATVSWFAAKEKKYEMLKLFVRYNIDVKLIPYAEQKSNFSLLSIVSTDFQLYQICRKYFSVEKRSNYDFLMNMKLKESRRKGYSLHVGVLRRKITSLDTALYCIHQLKKHNMNVRLPCGKTALMLAVEQCKDENTFNIVKKLLNFGADVNMKYSSGIYQGWTVLHYAVKFKTIKLISLLLKHGAKLDCEEIISPVLFAMNEHFEQRPEVFKVILKNLGPNILIGNWSLLHHAIERKNINSVKTLLNANVSLHSISVNDHEGVSPLFTAVRLRRTAIVKILRARSAPFTAGKHVKSKFEVERQYLKMMSYKLMTKRSVNLRFENIEQTYFMGKKQNVKQNLGRLQKSYNEDLHFELDRTILKPRVRDDWKLFNKYVCEPKSVKSNVVNVIKKNLVVNWELITLKNPVWSYL